MKRLGVINLFNMHAKSALLLGECNEAWKNHQLFVEQEVFSSRGC